MVLLSSNRIIIFGQYDLFEQFGKDCQAAFFYGKVYVCVVIEYY